MKSLLNRLIGTALVFSSLIFNIAHAKAFDQIIAFGDSLSDNGNIYSLTERASKVIPNMPVIPSNPYYEGRFSNGPVWVEQLAQLLNVPLNDYAYGGAWVESYYYSHQLVPFNLGTQVDFYLVKAELDYSKENHLYVIWMGGNDYISGRNDIESATSNVIATIQNNIEWLIYYGAKNIMVLNQPNLGLTPEAQQQGEKAAETLSKLSSRHNLKLDEMLTKLKETYPDVSFIKADIEASFDDMTNQPEKYNLRNVHQACLSVDTQRLRGFTNQAEISALKKANLDVLNNPSLRVAYDAHRSAFMGSKSCQNADDYLFWDHIHPTHAVHQIIANLVYAKLSSLQAL